MNTKPQKLPDLKSLSTLLTDFPDSNLLAELHMRCETVPMFVAAMKKLHNFKAHDAKPCELRRMQHKMEGVPMLENKHMIVGVVVATNAAGDVIGYYDVREDAHGNLL